MKERYWAGARTLGRWLSAPLAAWSEHRFEVAGASGLDHGAERVLPEVIEWICRAQDCSRTADGGVARDFSLINGWASSYPETTGYIVPTLLSYSRLSGRLDLVERVQRMVQWLVSIQLPSGAFQGGKADSRPVVPVTFNTGQILLGLASAHRALGGLGEPLQRAADWLVKVQDADGCWRQYPSPFAEAGEKVYETHAAWGLLEAARLVPDRGYAEAALANVRWALGFQSGNGWLQNCCLDGATEPLTHTIGYALRGFIEAYRYCGDPSLLEASRRTADGVLNAMSPDGNLPGRLRSDWAPSVNWVCLTGSAQISCCWLLLYEMTGEERYFDAALRANAYVRRTVRIDGAPEVRGAVKGSFPVSGAYGRFQYLNWAAKFLADSLMLEIDVRRRGLAS